MFESVGQPLIFLSFLLGGVILGLVYEVGYFARFCFKFGRIPSIIIDIAFMVAACAIIIIAANTASYGEIRAYSLASFIIGYILEMLTIHKLFSKVVNMVYNQLAKVLTTLKKSKFFAKIFK